MRKQILLLTAMLALLLLLTGCAGILQITGKTFYDRCEISYFAQHNVADQIYEDQETLYLRCPVVPFRTVHSWAFVALTPAHFGGVRYRHAEDLPDRPPVWVKCRKEEYENSSMFSPLSHPAIVSRNPNWQPPGKPYQPPKANDEDPFSFLDMPLFHSPCCHESTDCKPTMALVDTEYDANFFDYLLFGTTLLAIDIPISLVMTFSGPFWYIPLAEIY